jgi:type II secretory pathway pseudopilin PulG
MKLAHFKQSERTAAFTMVELALCMAIVAFAMVAIIGILPTGLTVQKQNREEAVLTQDAQTLMDAIRTGATTMDELTNFVDWIEVTRTGPSPSSNHFAGLHDPSGLALDPYKGPLDGSRIIGLISRPKYERYNVGNNTNITYIETNAIVSVYLRPFSGTITDKPYHYQGGDYQPTANQLDFTFRYKATVEIIPVFANFYGLAPPYAPTNLPASPALSDVRITLQWPVIALGAGGNLKVKLGPNIRTFHTQIQGTPMRFPAITNDSNFTIFATNTPIIGVTRLPHFLYRFQPGTL